MSATREFIREHYEDSIAACKRAAQLHCNHGDTFFVVKTLGVDPPLFTVTDEPTTDDPSHTVTWMAGEDVDAACFTCSGKGYVGNRQQCPRCEGDGRAW